MTITPCPDPGRLAAAASDEDAAALAHAARCERCRPVVDELRATRGELAALPPPALTASRRASIEDAVLVAVDAGALAPRRTWRAAAAAVVFAAAAAILVVALARRGGRDRGPRASGLGPQVETTTTVEPIPAPAPIPDPTPPVPAAPIIEAVGATDHSVDLSTETLALRDGAVVVDTRKSGPLSVTLGGATRVKVSDARVEVRAKKGVLVAVHVFAGSAEVTTGRRRAEIVAGDVWEPEAPGPKPAAATPPTGVDDFRRGWLALRAGDHDAATAAFDRATDPAVAEDAAFWAAVARERAGDTADARTRFERFLAAFPASARADAAREHLTAIDR